MAIIFNCQKSTKILIFLFSFTLSKQICINKKCKILISANFLPLIMAIQLDEILWNEPVTVFLAAVQFVARCHMDEIKPMHSKYFSPRSGCWVVTRPGLILSSLLFPVCPFFVLCLDEESPSLCFTIISTPFCFTLEPGLWIRIRIFWSDPDPFLF